jgi:hypothetical protein
MWKLLNRCEWAVENLLQLSQSVPNSNQSANKVNNTCNLNICGALIVHCRVNEWRCTIPICRRQFFVSFYPTMTKVQPAAPLFTEKELENIYMKVLHSISVRAIGTDMERQAMIDAVREFYDLLDEAIHTKAER